MHIAGRLDPVSGEAFLRLLDRRAKELFEQDWARAQSEAAEGEVITKGMLRRSDAQRRLDALVSLVIDGSSTPEGAQRPEPLIFFGTDSLTFEGFLAEMLGTDLADDTSTGDPGSNASEPGVTNSNSNDTSSQSDTYTNDSNTESRGSGTTTDRAADNETTDPDASDRARPNADTGDSSNTDQEPSTRPRTGLQLPDTPTRPVISTQPDTSAAVDPMRRCETGQGYPVPFRVMLQQLLTCRIRRVVYGAPNVIINAGETRRLFSPVQRELIKHRDRCCSFPGCHRDAIYCEADHILAYTNGGGTDLANGQCLRRYHHQLKTRGRFYCQPLDDGRTGFFLPTGIQIE